MPTEACEIDRRIVNKAEKMAKAGLNGTHTFKDYGKLGLHLRVRGHRAVWLTKYKQYTRTIGQLHPQPAERPITSVRTARETAANIRAVLKSQPEKFDDYMAHRDNGHTHENAVAKLIEFPDGWTLRECFDATLQDKLSENSKKKIGAATARDIRYILSLRTWGETLDQPATRLTQGDLETVRNATHKAHGVSASLKLVSYTREALTVRQHLTDLRTHLERVDESDLRSDREEVLREADSKLNQNFNHFSDTAQKLSLEMEIDAELFSSILSALSLCGGAQFKVLLALNEKEAAAKRGSGNARQVNRIAWNLPADEMRNRLAQKSAAPSLASDLAELRARLATQPITAAALIQNEIHGMEYIENAGSEEEEPLLILPQV